MTEPAPPARSGAPGPGACDARLWFNRLLIAVGTVLIVCAAIAIICPERANAVNAVAVSLTGVAILIYINDTRRIAAATEATMQSAGRPRISLALAVEAHQNDIMARPSVTNKSGFFCEVRTEFRFRIYGQMVSLEGHYNGETPWAVMPETTNYGVFSVAQLLGKAGKNLQQVMMDKATPDSEKLSVEVMLRAKGFPGEEIEYPRPLKWYLILTSGKAPDWVYMS